MRFAEIATVAGVGAVALVGLLVWLDLNQQKIQIGRELPSFVQFPTGQRQRIADDRRRRLTPECLAGGDRDERRVHPPAEGRQHRPAAVGHREHVTQSLQAGVVDGRLSPIRSVEQGGCRHALIVWA